MKLRALTVTATVGLVLFMTAGVASASPGTGPAYPAWLPEWLYVPYTYVWYFGDLLAHGYNPFTGSPW